MFHSKIRPLSRSSNIITSKQKRITHLKQHLNYKNNQIFKSYLSNGNVTKNRNFQTRSFILPHPKNQIKNHKNIFSKKPNQIHYLQHKQKFSTISLNQSHFHFPNVNSHIFPSLTTLPDKLQDIIKPFQTNFSKMIELSSSSIFLRQKNENTFYKSMKTIQNILKDSKTLFSNFQQPLVTLPSYLPGQNSEKNESIKNLEEEEENDFKKETIIMIKRTYQPSKIKRRRKFGFFARVKTKSGRRVLKNRRRKGRRTLAA